MKKIIGYIYYCTHFNRNSGFYTRSYFNINLYTKFHTSTGSLEMANLLQYTISAITVTIALWSVYKVKNILKSSKSSVKVS